MNNEHYDIYERIISYCLLYPEPLKENEQEQNVYGHED